MEYLMKGIVPSNVNTFHIIISQTPKFHNYTLDLEGSTCELHCTFVITCFNIT